MRNQEKLIGLLVIILIIFFASYINEINGVLSGTHDQNVEFGHSATKVPKIWTTIKDSNQTNMAKTPDAITNGYIYIDHWDDWPEDHITSISEAKFKEMEDGGYKILKNENTTIYGTPVSKQYFSNPSRNNSTVWNHVGVSYVFPKEDTNYAIQVNYFTSQDYNNDTFVKEIDECVGEDIDNLHNKNYNILISVANHIYGIVSGKS
ncbi:hypothetical protein [Methanobrevibacter sp.]|uniref:hypothetical protein n=1 Tax=Methanobrevibacter sp. TaxID=66852 RepID=UPI00386E97CF